MTWLALIKLRNGELILWNNWTWTAEPADNDLLVAMAESATLKYSPPLYEYSPADGKPGARIAYELAQRFQGTVTLPDYPPAPPDTIF